MKFLLKKNHSNILFRRRLTALGLCLLMILQSTHSYADRRQSPQKLSYEINIPADLGLIESFHPGTNGKTIIFIQDAHDSLEAQENIAKIIQLLVEKQGVRTVFEEGYEGKLPTEEYFGDIEDAVIKEKLSYFFMDKLRLGGAEYAHINRSQDFDLVGVDDRELHRENIEAYQAAFKLKESTLQDLNNLKIQLQKLAYQVFPGKIKKWIKIKARFESDQIDLIDYLKRTYELLGEHFSAKRYPNIYQLLKADRFKDSDSLSHVEKMDHQKLFSEIDKIEESVAQLLIADERQKIFFEYLKDLQLLERLNEIEISEDEYAAMSKRLKSIETQKMIQFIANEAKKPVALSKRWEENIHQSMRFYELAQERDLRVGESIQKNIEVKNEEFSILVFGGFHKNKIQAGLKKQGFSVYTIAPKISEMSIKHQNYYKQVMGVGHYAYETPLFVARAAKPFDVMDLKDQYSPQMLLSITRNPAIDWTLERDLLARQLESLDLWQEARSELRLSTEVKESALRSLANALNENFNPRERLAISNLEKRIMGLSDGVKEAIYSFLKKGVLEPRIVMDYLLTLNEDAFVQSHRIFSEALRQISIQSNDDRIRYEKSFFEIYGQHESPFMLSLDDEEFWKNTPSQHRFSGRIQALPYTVVRGSMIKALDDAQVLAIFPDYSINSELSVIESSHVFDALAFVVFYEREVEGKKTFVISQIQSDAYRHLVKIPKLKKRYQDWRWAMRAALEKYAIEQKIEQIASPTSDLIRERWRGISSELANIVYDMGMSKNGYRLLTINEAIKWDSEIKTKKWWVKSLLSETQNKRSELRAHKATQEKTSVYDLVHEAIQAVRKADMADRTLQIKGEEHSLISVLESFQTAIRVGNRGKDVFDFKLLLPMLDEVIEQLAKDEENLKGGVSEVYDSLKRISSSINRSELRVRYPEPIAVTEGKATLPQAKRSYIDRHRQQWELIDQNYFDFIIERAQSRVAQNQKPEIRILDYGSASGEEAVRLSYLVSDSLEKRGKNLEDWNISIIGLDYDSEMVAESRRRLSGKTAFYGVLREADSRKFSKEVVANLESFLKKEGNILRFERANLFDASNLALKYPEQDIVFINHVFRELSEKEQSQAAQLLSRSWPKSIFALGDRAEVIRSVQSHFDEHLMDVFKETLNANDTAYSFLISLELLDRMFQDERDVIKRSELRNEQNVKNIADHEIMVEPLLALHQMGIDTYENHFGGEYHSFSRPADQTDIQVGRLTNEQKEILKKNSFVLDEPEYNGKKLRSWDSDRHTNIGFKRNPKDAEEEIKRIVDQWRVIVALLRSVTPMVEKTTSYSNEQMRYLDLVVASLFVIPSFLMIGLLAPWVKMANPELSVFFLQERMGFRGQTFQLYKLRTMDAHGYPIKLFGFPLGKFLRLTALDELPQFFNVLKGDMAIFGPRPLMAKIATQESIDKIFNYRKPGLFSLYSSKTGAGRGLNSIDLTPYIEAHVEELNSWSWRTPFKILFLAVQILYTSLTKSFFELDDSEYADPKRVPRSEVTSPSEDIRSELRMSQNMNFFEMSQDDIANALPEQLEEWLSRIVRHERGLSMKIALERYLEKSVTRPQNDFYWYSDRKDLVFEYLLTFSDSKVYQTEWQKLLNFIEKTRQSEQTLRKWLNAGGESLQSNRQNLEDALVQITEILHNVYPSAPVVSASHLADGITKKTTNVINALHLYGDQFEVPKQRLEALLRQFDFVHKLVELKDKGFEVFPGTSNFYDGSGYDYDALLEFEKALESADQNIRSELRTDALFAYQQGSSDEEHFDFFQMLTIETGRSLEDIKQKGLRVFVLGSEAGDFHLNFRKFLSEQGIENVTILGVDHQRVLFGMSKKTPSEILYGVDLRDYEAMELSGRGFSSKSFDLTIIDSPNFPSEHYPDFASAHEWLAAANYFGKEGAPILVRLYERPNVEEMRKESHALREELQTENWNYHEFTKSNTPAYPNGNYALGPLVLVKEKKHKLNGNYQRSELRNTEEVVGLDPLIDSASGFSTLAKESKKIETLEEVIGANHVRVDEALRAGAITAEKAKNYKATFNALQEVSQRALEIFEASVREANLPLYSLQIVWVGSRLSGKPLKQVLWPESKRDSDIDLVMGFSAFEGGFLYFTPQYEGLMSAAFIQALEEKAVPAGLDYEEILDAAPYSSSAERRLENYADEMRVLTRIQLILADNWQALKGDKIYQDEAGRPRLVLAELKADSEVFRPELRSSGSEINLKKFVESLLTGVRWPDTIHVDIDPELSISNLASTSSLAIFELVKNAIDGNRVYEKKSGLNSDPDVLITAEKSGEWILLNIVNRGILAIDKMRSQVKKEGIWKLNTDFDTQNQWPFLYIMDSRMPSEPMPYNRLSDEQIDKIPDEDLLFHTQGLTLRSDENLKRIGMQRSDLTGGMGIGLKRSWQVMRGIDPERAVRYESGFWDGDPSVIFNVRLPASEPRSELRMFVDDQVRFDFIRANIPYRDEHIETDKGVFRPTLSGMMEPLARFANSTNPKKIIDMGSGQGAMAIAFAIENQEVEVLGIEFDPTLFKESVQVKESLFPSRKNRMRFEQGDFNDPKFSEEIQTADLINYWETGARAEDALLENLSKHMRHNSHFLLTKNYGFILNKIENSGYFDLVKEDEKGIYLYRRNDNPYRSELRMNEEHEESASILTVEEKLFVQLLQQIHDVKFPEFADYRGDPKNTADGLFLPSDPLMLAEILKGTLRSGDHFIDLGSGSGMALFVALALGAGYVTGFETDSSLNEAARDIFEQLQEVDAFDIPVKDDSFRIIERDFMDEDLYEINERLSILSSRNVYYYFDVGSSAEQIRNEEFLRKIKNLPEGSLLVVHFRNYLTDEDLSELELVQKIPHSRRSASYVYRVPKRLAKKKDDSVSVMSLKMMSGETPGSGNLFDLRFGKTRLLLDAGKFPESNFDTQTPVDAVLVSHGHRDHIESLPKIANAFPQTPLLMSSPTAIYGSNHWREAKHTKKEIEKATSNTSIIREGVWYQLNDETKILFSPASHILGADLIYISTPRGNFLYTGDYSDENLRSVPNLQLLDDFEVDYLISESVYGDRPDVRDRDSSEKRLVEFTRETFSRDGNILIPGFTIGRIPEIVTILRHYQKRGEIDPKARLYVDGQAAMVMENYESYLSNSESEEDKELLELLFGESSTIVYVKPWHRSRILNRSMPEDPRYIYLAGHGMLDGGRSVQALSTFANEKDSVLQVGYQGAGTLGRRILDKHLGGESPIQISYRIDGQQKSVNIHNYEFIGFSAHASQSGLLKLMGDVNPRITVLIHGDDKAKAELKRILKENVLLEEGHKKVLTPREGDELTFKLPKGLSGKRAKSFAEIKAVSLPRSPHLIYELPELGSSNYDESRREFTSHFLDLLGQTHDSFNRKVMGRWIDAVHSGDLNETLKTLRRNRKSVFDGEGTQKEKEEQLSIYWDQIVNEQGDLEDQYNYWIQRILKELKRPTDVHHKAAVRLYLDKEGPVAVSYFFMRELAALRQQQNDTRVANQWMWGKIAESVGVEVLVAQQSKPSRNSKTPEQRLKEHVDDYSQKIHQALVAQHENSDPLTLSLEEVKMTVEAWLTQTALFWNDKHLSTAKVATWMTFNHKAKEGSGIDWISMWNDISLRFSSSRSELRTEDDIESTLQRANEALFNVVFYQTHPNLLTLRASLEKFQNQNQELANQVGAHRNAGVALDSPFEWIHYIHQRNKLQEQDRILDVGAGLSAFAFAELTGADITAIELDPMRFSYWTTFKKFLEDEEGLSYPNLKIEQADFINYDISSFDLIYFYFTSPKEYYDTFGNSIVHKLDNELPEGAVFISPGFYLFQELTKWIYDTTDRESLLAETNLKYTSLQMPKPADSKFRARGATMFERRSELRSETSSFKGRAFDFVKQEKARANTSEYWKDLGIIVWSDLTNAGQVMLYADNDHFEWEESTTFKDWVPQEKQAVLHGLALLILEAVERTEDVREDLSLLRELTGMTDEELAILFFDVRSAFFPEPKETSKQALTVEELAETEFKIDKFVSISQSLSQLPGELGLMLHQLHIMHFANHHVTATLHEVVDVEGIYPDLVKAIQLIKNDFENHPELSQDKKDEYRKRLQYSLARLVVTLFSNQSLQLILDENPREDVLVMVKWLQENVVDLIPWVEEMEAADLVAGVSHVQLATEFFVELEKRWDSYISTTETQDTLYAFMTDPQAFRRHLPFLQSLPKFQGSRYQWEMQDSLMAFETSSLSHLQVYFQPSLLILFDHALQRMRALRDHQDLGFNPQVLRNSREFDKFLSESSEPGWIVYFEVGELDEYQYLASEYLNWEHEKQIEGDLLRLIAGSSIKAFRAQHHARRDEGLNQGYLFLPKKSFSRKEDVENFLEKLYGKLVKSEEKGFAANILAIELNIKLLDEDDRDHLEDALQSVFGTLIHQKDMSRIRRKKESRITIYDKPFTGDLMDQLDDEEDLMDDFDEESGFSDIRNELRVENRSELRRDVGANISRLINVPKQKGTLALSVERLGRVDQQFRDELLSAIFDRKEIKLVLYADSVEIDSETAKWRDQLASLSNVVVVSAPRNEALEKWGLPGSVAVDLIENDEVIEENFIPGQRIKKLEHVRLKNLGDVLMAKLVATTNEEELWWIHKIDGAMESLPGFQSELQSFFAEQAIAWSA